MNLHGENHLGRIADTFDSPARAVAAFERAHGEAVRPGPARMTDTERQTVASVTSLRPSDAGAPDQPRTPNLTEAQLSRLHS